MKYLLVKLSIIISGFYNIVEGQLNEIKEFQQKNTKTYLSNGIGKSKGLKFSIQYPASYKAYDIPDYGMVKGFSKDNSGMGFMIGLLYHEESLSLEGKKHMLSQNNLEKSMRSISSTAQVIAYKTGFEVDGYMAAHLDFQVNDDKNGSLIIRTCYIEVNNYSVIISFIFPLSPKLSLTSATQKINTYYPLFEFVINSFKVSNQKKQNDDMELSVDEYLKYKKQVPETDKNPKNNRWTNELYRNVKYKFRVSFPKNWEYDGGAGNKIVARATNREKAATVAVSVTHLEHIKSKDSSNIFKTPPLTKDQMNKFFELQNMKAENYKSEKAYLNNFPAYMYEFTSEVKAGTDTYTYFSKQIQCLCQNKVYTLVINLPLENWDEEMIILFDRFIKSFVFEIVF